MQSVARLYFRLKKPFAVLLLTVFSFSALQLGTYSFSIYESLAADSPQFSAIKQGSNAISPGEVVTYIITLKNTGGTAQDGIRISDPVPANLAFQTQGSTDGCTLEGSNVVCPAKSFSPNETTAYTLKFLAGAGLACGSKITNTANVQKNGGTFMQTNPLLSDVECGTARLDVTKSAPAFSQLGGTVTYTYTIRNMSATTTASQINFYDFYITNQNQMMQPPFNFISSSLTGQQCKIEEIHNTGFMGVTCRLTQSIAPNQSITFTNTYSIPNNPAFCGKSFVNQVDVNVGTDPNADWDKAQTTIKCRPDLYVVKLAPASVNAGSNITYSYTLENTSDFPANDVNVTDFYIDSNMNQIASPFNFVSASGINCMNDFATGKVRCDAVDLAAHQTIAFTMTFSTPSDHPTMCNQTFTNRVEAIVGDDIETLDSDTASTVLLCPTPKADLSITKTGPATILAGSTISYTLTASNAGPATATNVVIADPIPSGLTFNAAQSDAGCVQNGANILCNNFSLTNGQSRSFTIAFNLPAVNPNDCTPTTIQNRASVSASSSDPNSSNNQSTIVTTNVTCPVPQGADVAIVKTGPATILAGSTITYTLTASNAGPATATNLIIKDTFPAGFTFNAAQSDSSCALNGSVVQCAPFSLLSGQSRTFTLSFTLPTVNPAQCNPTTVENRATLWGSETDPVSSNNKSTFTTNVTCPVVSTDLSIVKTGPATVIAGGVITYTLTASNAGPSPATGVIIEDPIPAGLTFLPTQSDALCKVSGANILCSPFTLNAGQSRSFQVMFHLPPVDPAACVPGSVLNYAKILGGQSDPDTSNNTSAIVTTQLTCPPPMTDLSIVKSGPATVQAGGTILYSLTVTNAGPSNATGVTVTDPIPSGLTFIPAQSDSACVVSGGNIVCSNIALTSGQSRTLQLAFTAPSIAECTPRTIQNQATVTGTQTDPHTSNNTSTIVSTQLTCPPQGADLSIVKTGPSSIVAGGVATYTLVVTNAGPATATNLVITDNVPSGLTFNGNFSDSACSLNDNKVTCTHASLASGQSRSLTVAFNVPVTSTCNANIVNQASVAATQTDPNMSNNVSATVTTNVLCPAPSFTISKTDNRTTVAPGETLTYSITVTNTSAFAVSNATVIDTLPSNVTFVSASDSGLTSTGNTIRWQNLSFAPGQTRTLTLAVKVNDNAANNTVLLNTVTVQGGPSATDTTTVQVTQQLGCIDITKEVLDQNNNFVTPVPSFTMRLSNGQTVTTDSQGHARFNSIATGNYSVSEDFISGYTQLSVVPANGNVTVTSGTNCATIVFKNRQNSSGTQTFTISKTDNRTTVHAGDTLTYNITVTNTSNVSSNSVTIVDILPQYVNFQSASNGGTINGSTVTWSNQTFSANESRVFTLTVRVSDSAPGGSVIMNVAQVGAQYATDTTSVITQVVYNPPVYPPVVPPPVYQPPVYYPPAPNYKPYPYPIPVTGHDGDTDGFFQSGTDQGEFLTAPVQSESSSAGIIAYVSIFVTTMAGLASAAGGTVLKLFS